MVSWRKAMARGLARLQEDSRELEAGATVILNFQTAGVPGLLQVPEYARRVFATERQASQADIAAAVAARMNRQAAILYEGSRHLEFIMTEAAARWRLGPAGLMRAQTEKIIDVASLENVTVGIIRQDTEADMWHDHGFNILELQAEGEAVVHVETLTRGLTITDPADVAAYKDAFARLRKLAVIGEDAQTLLRQIAQA